MLDRQWMLAREDRRDKEARRMRYAEFMVALLALILIVIAALIEKSGQPTIIINTHGPTDIQGASTPVIMETTALQEPTPASQLGTSSNAP